MLTAISLVICFHFKCAIGLAHLAQKGSTGKTSYDSWAQLAPVMTDGRSIKNCTGNHPVCTNIKKQEVSTAVFVTFDVKSHDPKALQTLFFCGLKS